MYITKNSIKKWTEDLNQQFPKEAVEMANRHMKSCATQLVIREMQMTPTRYQLTLVRMVIIKKNTNNKHWRGCGEKECLYTVGGNVNW